MIPFALYFAAGMTVIVISTVLLVRGYRRRKAIAAARQAGAAIDKSGIIHARASFQSMSAKDTSGECAMSPRQRRFMELLRICSEGPRTIEEIRFLFAEGIEPMVRPDGVVYVPCIENKHLYMEGEIELTEDDLDLFIRRQIIKLQNGSGEPDFSATVH